MASYWDPDYTSELTPRLDVSPDVMRALLGEPDELVETPWRRHFRLLREPDRVGVEAFCAELDCLHQEFGFIVEEMDQAIRVLYGDYPRLQRLSLIYHTDSFFFRVHAYREKVFRLVNHWCALDVPSTAKGSNEAVLRGLGERALSGVVRALRSFSQEPMFERAVWLRNRLNHDLARRDEMVSGVGTGKWPSLQASSRIDDVVFAHEEVHFLLLSATLQVAHSKVQEDLGKLLERLETFRGEIIATLKTLTS